MKRISDELAKNNVNQSKLSERYRKNSGKGTNLFILNPSNKKKFSTVRINLMSFICKKLAKSIKDNKSFSNNFSLPCFREY